MFAKAKKHPTNVLLYHFIVCLSKKTTFSSLNFAGNTNATKRNYDIGNNSSYTVMYVTILLFQLFSIPSCIFYMLYI